MFRALHIGMYILLETLQ